MTIPFDTTHLPCTTKLASIAISYQIMTRAEPVELVKATINSLINIKAPQDEILIIDNNHSDTSLYKPLQRYCESFDSLLNVRFYHEDHISGYKSGALNYALQRTNDACNYIVVVDSDYQALPFAREKIVQAIAKYPTHALLQFPQYYRDIGNVDIHNELNHYFSYHLQRDFNRGMALSTGTYAVIKKEALVRLGGWSSTSITEDAQMGVHMHRAGESSQFIAEVIATGLLPQTLTDLVAQRKRWIYGNMQVFNDSFSKGGVWTILLSMVVPMSAMSAMSATHPIYTYVNRQSPHHLSYPSCAISFRANLLSSSLLSPSLPRSIKNKQLNKQLKAHISQLSAWVNFTGAFIGLQSLCVLALLGATITGKDLLVKPALKGLSICYGSYFIYLSRRCIAYMLDTKPLLNRADKAQLNRFYYRHSKYACYIKKWHKTSKQVYQKNKAKTTFTFKATANTKTKISIFAKANTFVSKFFSKLTPTNLSNQRLSKKVGKNIKSLKGFINKGISKTCHKVANGYRHFVKVTPTNLFKARNTDNPNHDVANSNTRKPQDPTYERLESPQTSLLESPPISTRLKAFLIHINFWEMGALSWFPVLWGQKRPFVRTPKVEVTPSKLITAYHCLRALPKLLFVLNLATLILVYSHSARLSVLALSIVVLKLSAGGLMFANFMSSTPKHSDLPAQQDDKGSSFRYQAPTNAA